MCSEDHQAGLGGGAVAPSECAALQGQAPRCWNRSVADWMGCNLLSQNWGAVRERKSIAKPHKYSYIRKKRHFFCTIYPSISYRKFSSSIILRDRCHVYDPSLTKHCMAYDCYLVYSSRFLSTTGSLHRLFLLPGVISLPSLRILQVLYLGKAFLTTNTRLGHMSSL